MTKSSRALIFARNGSNLSSGSALGPSYLACPDFGAASRNRPAKSKPVPHACARKIDDLLTSVAGTSAGWIAILQCVRHVKNERQVIGRALHHAKSKHVYN